MSYIKKYLFLIFSFYVVTSTCLSMQPSWKEDVYNQGLESYIESNNGDTYELDCNADMYGLKEVFNDAFNGDCQDSWNDVWEEYAQKTPRFCYEVKVSGKEEKASFIFGYFKNEREVFVSYVGTAKKHQKQGLAWKLISSVFEKNPRVTKIILFPKNNKSKEFFIKHGFKEQESLIRVVLKEENIYAKYELTRDDFEKKNNKKNSKGCKLLNPKPCICL